METVLHPQVHHRLIADMANICTHANIPPSMMHRSAKEWLGPVELDWLVNLKVMQQMGRSLLLTGNQDAEVKMMAMAAAMLRNFIDARLIPLNTLLQMLDDGSSPAASVILIPNLFMRSTGRALPAWKVQIVYDYLLARLTAGKVTVVYVEDMASLEKDFGQVFAKHLVAHYKIVGDK